MPNYCVTILSKFIIRLTLIVTFPSYIMNIDNVRTVPGLGCDSDRDCRGTDSVCVQNKCGCRNGYIQDNELCIKLPGKTVLQPNEGLLRLGDLVLALFHHVVEE
jgi:hypothetical protein